MMAGHAAIAVKSPKTIIAASDQRSRPRQFTIVTYESKHSKHDSLLQMIEKI